MKKEDIRRYGISEVSEMTEVPVYLLRQWEDRITQLKPKRDRANRRYYVKADIAIVRRIKQLLRHDKMTMEGVRMRLAEELRGEGRPRTRQEALDLLARLEEETRAMLDLLESE